MKQRELLAFASGAMLAVLIARIVLASPVCNADTYCGVSGCGLSTSGTCQCCSRGVGVRECCPNSCTQCTLPLPAPKSEPEE